MKKSLFEFGQPGDGAFDLDPDAFFVVSDDTAQCVLAGETMNEWAKPNALDGASHTEPAATSSFFRRRRHACRLGPSRGDVQSKSELIPFNVRYDRTIDT